MIIYVYLKSYNVLNNQHKFKCKENWHRVWLGMLTRHFQASFIEWAFIKLLLTSHYGVVVSGDARSVPSSTEFTKYLRWSLGQEKAKLQLIWEWNKRGNLEREIDISQLIAIIKVSLGFGKRKSQTFVWQWQRQRV